MQMNYTTHFRQAGFGAVQVVIDMQKVFFRQLIHPFDD